MNNSRILTTNNTKFSGYYFFMNFNIQGDSQICISVSLTNVTIIVKVAMVTYIHCENG